MSENISTASGYPFPALGGTGAAAYVEVIDEGSGPDEYDKLLAALGRFYEDDARVAIHEAGHAVCARLLGNPLGGVTVQPTKTSDGLCWGVGHEEAFAEGRGDASDVREVLAEAMPKAGEQIESVSDVFANVYSHCIELMAGCVAETMLLGEQGVGGADDLRQARELALLFCMSEEAVESFVQHCRLAARDMLMPYGDVVMALSVVLRIKRTLSGAEIDKIISDVQARMALVSEHRRRADWRQREISAARLRSS
ncbi:hypothetical protein [Bradyrhizobium sp. STM 3809]|uniref:hypothetical protein n=1 Tax=Bradyrhizobium sp. STM 3809 TaxID=551936 RepID=UPI000240925F|nr:hypothetical protein [Bradyrhizobium sp. STM 3809]CCE00661.1 hypothetical protein BRAS3809_360004 [Bradyrhizobium sp. STM 3809]